MLSRLLAIPFLIAIIITLYFCYEVSSSYSVYTIPPFLALAAIYFLQPQIDWWWYKKHVPEMDAKLEGILRQRLSFYAGLSNEEQKRFRDRVTLYTLANEFIAKGIEEDGVPPDDVKAFIATCVTQLTFGRSDYRLPKFERIVVYPAPFPSPQYPTHIHSSEIFAEDGVLLFAIDPLMLGIVNEQFYNIGLHEYAKAFMESYPVENYPSREEFSWEVLAKISGFSRQKIEEQMGLPDIDPLAVAIHHFMVFPQNFQQQLPDVYHKLSMVFNLDLVQTQNPVLDRSKLDVEQK